MATSVRDWVRSSQKMELGFYYFYLWCNASVYLQDGLKSSCTWVRPGCWRICSSSPPSALSQSCLPARHPTVSKLPPVVNCTSPIDSRSPLGVVPSILGEEVFYLSQGQEFCCFTPSPVAVGLCLGPRRQEGMLSPAVVNVFYSKKV